MRESVIEECQQLLRLRYKYDRRPKYFYMDGDTYTQLVREADRINMRISDHALLQPMYSFHLFGLEVKVMDFPPGFILCSETRLH